ncbi:unnamed protein product, partial [Brassica oleracea]
MCSQVTPAELFLYHPSLSMLGGFTHSPNGTNNSGVRSFYLQCGYKLNGTKKMKLTLRTYLNFTSHQHTFTKSYHPQIPPPKKEKQNGTTESPVWF